MRLRGLLEGKKPVPGCYDGRGICWRPVSTARPRWIYAGVGRARGFEKCPLGYRQPEGDWLVNLQKVRRPRSAFITEV